MSTELDTQVDEQRLDSTQIRILGALIEKQATSPETYPLTLNAVVLACNGFGGNFGHGLGHTGRGWFDRCLGWCFGRRLDSDTRTRDDGKSSN